MKIESFKSILPKYKVIFFDAFGVLKNYKGLLPGVENTFEYLKQHGQEYYIVTNDASRSPKQLAESYHNAGLNAITEDRIISSGMITKEFIDLKVDRGIVAYLGTANSAHYLADNHIKLLPVCEIDDSNINDVNALVLLDDEGFDWFQDLNKTINLLRKRTIPAIVANTDNTYPVTKNDVSIAIGGVATMLESILGRKFIRFGKPDTQMFMFAFETLRLKMEIHKKEILMVGDTLHTDILGGNKFGLDTALVLTGNTRIDDVDTKIKSTGIVPTHICDSVIID
jgi:HAD superfamily hydrolase (TIGR01450 family)